MVDKVEVPVKEFVIRVDPVENRLVLESGRDWFPTPATT
jgi:hypothetical protein